MARLKDYYFEKVQDGFEITSKVKALIDEIVDFCNIYKD